jgi:hypothetical protein
MGETGEMLVELLVRRCELAISLDCGGEIALEDRALAGPLSLLVAPSASTVDGTVGTVGTVGNVVSLGNGCLFSTGGEGCSTVLSCNAICGRDVLEMELRNLRFKLSFLRTMLAL